MKNPKSLKIVTQNPRRCPRFAVVVVVTFFSMKFLTISMFFQNVSFHRRNSTTNFGRMSLFRGKVTSSVGRKTKTHILPTKINEHVFAKVSSQTTIILLEKLTIQHHNNTTTTHNNNHNHNNKKTRNYKFLSTKFSKKKKTKT